MYKVFDTAVMGRKTFEVLTAQGGYGALPGLDVVVFSRTLPAATHPGVRIVNDDPRKVVATLKAKPVALSYSVPGGVGPAPRIRYIKAAKRTRSIKKRAPSRKGSRTRQRR
jgi:hypothetical protein